METENKDRNKTIVLKDRRIKTAHAEIDKKRAEIDFDIPAEHEMDEAIQLAIDNGDVTLHSLTKVVMQVSGSVDVLNDLIRKLYIALKIEINSDELEGANYAEEV